MFVHAVFFLPCSTEKKKHYIHTHKLHTCSYEKHRMCTEVVNENLATLCSVAAADFCSTYRFRCWLARTFACTTAALLRKRRYGLGCDTKQTAIQPKQQSRCVTVGVCSKIINLQTLAKAWQKCIKRGLVVYPWCSSEESSSYHNTCKGMANAHKTAVETYTARTA